MTEKQELICAWMGVVLIVLFATGWILLAGWIQPPAPSLTPEELAEIFNTNATRIKAGMVLIQYVGAANIPFAAVIMVVMLRMKSVSPAFAYTQFGAALVNSLLFIIPAQLFLTTAYRPDRLPEITQFGFDFGMIIIDNVVSTAMLQFVAIGIAILLDKSDRPAFPRWFAFACLWGAVMFIPANLIVFFKAGPMTWSGVLGWYLGVLVYFAWFCIQFPLLIKAIKNHYRTFPNSFG